jgi:hypothetical protein
MDDDDREFWMTIRRALLMIAAAIANQPIIEYYVDG